MYTMYTSIGTCSLASCWFESHEHQNACRLALHHGCIDWTRRIVLQQDIQSSAACMSLQLEPIGAQSRPITSTLTSDQLGNTMPPGIPGKQACLCQILYSIQTNTGTSHTSQHMLTFTTCN
jgi:hypothetical protein